MEWIERLNNTMDYIEEHLIEKIDYEQLSKIAGCPSYHFQKTFLYMTNISLNEYIRKRKISLAAVDIQSGKDKIIDIALKYGYESPTAFNRAFQSIHGIAPSTIRKKSVKLKSFPPLKFSFSLQGFEELNYRIENKISFKILGISYPLSKDLLENFNNIPNIWNNALNNGTLMQLINLNNQFPQGLLGVSIHYQNDWRYFIAVSSNSSNEQFEDYSINEATWAIFSGHGTNKSLQELQRRVITEWLPTSGYKYANIPDIEVYLKADPNDCIYEYWLPVIKNKE
ncbi:MAG: effector binding domain-containing protein [Thomasclavelia sp.]|uniref:AraC family transcriptional regulator n=1 Tax=Thomasclavelia sp. TaxID=3025757 RepID=UPI0039A32C34